MKVVIAGSRYIKDYKLIEKAIKASGFEITEVVSGNAEGVDKLGERWAEEHGIPIKKFPALWNALNQDGAIPKKNKFGKLYNANAGFFRNEQMAQYCDAVITIMMEDIDIFGTGHMAKMAKKYNKLCFEYTGKRKSSEYIYEF